MISNKYAYKCETLYNDPFEIMQCWTNVIVTFKMGAIKIRYIIRPIKTY